MLLLPSFYVVKCRFFDSYNALATKKASDSESSKWLKDSRKSKDEISKYVAVFKDGHI